MSEPKISKTWSRAGILCQIGSLSLITLSLTVFPESGVNIGLVFALLLGIMALAVSPSGVSPESGL